MDRVSKTAFKSFDQIVWPANTADKFCSKFDGGGYSIEFINLKTLEV